jgi:hypothetical protein
MVDAEGRADGTGTIRTMRRPRVLYYLSEYPMRSQTYIKSEIDALVPDYDVAIITQIAAHDPYRNHLPFDVVRDVEHAVELVQDFKPDVMHTQWLRPVPAMHEVSKRTGVPFTVRSHSFDTLWGGVRGRLYDHSPIGFRFLQGAMLAAAVPWLRDDACIGVLAFPFVVPRLRRAGVPASKLHASPPVVAVQRFLDRSPNGTGVICLGAARPKKGFGDFLNVAADVPDREFTLYPLGHAEHTAQLAAENRDLGEPVTIKDAVDPDDMLAEYKRNEWLLYTASRKNRSVGWPVAIAEAQAAGVGVCVPDLGRDIDEYLDGAGFTYSTLAEARDIVAKPYPEEMRERGFDVAKRSDIEAHKHLLTDLWPAHITAPEGQSSSRSP